MAVFFFLIFFFGFSQHLIAKDALLSIDDLDVTTSNEDDTSYVIDKSYKLRPYIGIWFGPVTIFPETELSKHLKTSLGGGLFVRLPLPFYDLRVEMLASYAYYPSSTLLSSFSSAGLHSVPVSLSLGYKLPIPGNLSYLIKIGFGGNFFYTVLDEYQNILPLFITGAELYFKTSAWLNLGVRVDYLLAIEEYLDVPSEIPNFKKVNGHFLKFGIFLEVTWVP